MYKKADGGLTAILIIIIIIIIISWLVNIGARECRHNSDCKDEYYCGSDFSCHKIPVIEKVTTPIVVQRNYVGPAWIIGIAMVVTAIIFNIDKIRPRRKHSSAGERIYTNIPVYYDEQGSK